MVLFLRELKRNRKGLIIWSSIFVLYNIMIFSMFPTLSQQSESYKQMMKSMPSELMAAFNIDTLDFSNILSFFGVYSHLYFVLAGSIYAMLLGAGILSKEESEKTVEFLLAKPVTRTTVVTAKLGCSLVYLFVFNLLFAVTTFVLTEIYGKSGYDVNALFLLSASPLLVFWLFMTLGMLISVFIVKAKTILPISMGTVMGTFILGVASRITDSAKGLIYLSPIDYVNSSDILKEGSIDMVFIVMLLGLTAVSIALTYFFYNKKDISV